MAAEPLLQEAPERGHHGFAPPELRFAGALAAAAFVNFNSRK